MQRNRLASETSPYLLQHASNPVDWHPWDAAALDTAKRENKPILLSVGYSACHWCHVMAHESFEDPATARLMNELFVNIKVDREERPDLDKIYQLAQQLITQRPGGWPLTMFLTPGDQQPFFGGTFFSKDARHGMPAFSEVLRRAADYYHGHAGQIHAQSSQLTLAFAQLMPTAAAPDAILDERPLRAGRAALGRAFDGEHGGFSQAPKFPSAASIERCFRDWYATSRQTSPDLQALYMGSLTLTRMAEGGIYDQLAGGFARYSTDRHWQIPHFEKMLYDNAQLLGSYAAAAVATGDELFARIAGETADWVLRDMRSPEGGFYSSLDADSAGEEGRFYVWTPAEIAQHVSVDEARVFLARFGLDGPPNFAGTWHLHAAQTPADIAAALSLPLPRVDRLLESARAKLLRQRATRVSPARDEKVLTAWNALMINGLALAARALRRRDLSDAATLAIDFIKTHLWRNGRLLAGIKDGRAHLPAYLDDYAFLIDAILQSLQTHWRTADLEFARSLADVLLARFEDPANGGFYFTAADHEHLIHRSKTYSDDATPAGNGIAAAGLYRLGILLGDLRYLRAAERTLLGAGTLLADYPLAHMSMLNALDEFLTSIQMIIIRGSPAEAQRWQQEIELLYSPSRSVFVIPMDTGPLPAALAAKRPVDGTVAYVCTGMTCAAPLSELAAVIKTLTLAV